MKASNLREMTIEELDEQRRVTQKELFDMRMEKVAGRVENPSRIRMLRRQIARIKTIMNERPKKS